MFRPGRAHRVLGASVGLVALISVVSAGVTTAKTTADPCTMFALTDAKRVLGDSAVLVPRSAFVDATIPGHVACFYQSPPTKLGDPSPTAVVQSWRHASVSAGFKRRGQPVHIGKTTAWYLASPATLVLSRRGDLSRVNTLGTQDDQRTATAIARLILRRV